MEKKGGKGIEMPRMCKIQQNAWHLLLKEGNMFHHHKCLNQPIREGNTDSVVLYISPGSTYATERRDTVYDR